MLGEIHDADHIDRGKVVIGIPLFLLPEDGEGRVEYGPFVEVFLVGDLHFNDEPGAVPVMAFHIDTDVFLGDKGIDVFGAVYAFLIQIR